MFSMSCRSSPGGRKGGMELSDHAVQRCTQRGIRALQDEWLRKFGVRIWKYGAEI